MGRYHDWQCDGCGRRASELLNTSDYNSNGHPRAYYYRLLNYATEHNEGGEEIFADVLCKTCDQKNLRRPHLPLGTDE